ncbi:MAG: phospholipid scramblase-related protein [Acidimicrobiales bacterium]
MSNQEPNWYPDPGQRHEYRYWDGTTWTDHVSNGGVTSSEPLAAPPPPGNGAQPPPPAGTAATAAGGDGLDRLEDSLLVGDSKHAKQVRKQMTAGGRSGIGLQGPVAGGGGTVLTEPILVVNQKAKLMELTNQYRVFDQHGNQIAMVNQVGQSSMRKVLRLMSNLDSLLTHRLDVTDTNGHVLLRVTRPGTMWKSTVIVSDGADNEYGRIVQQNVMGKIRFAFKSGETTLGELKAENWRAWNFRIEDTNGAEVARITKTWEGVTKAMFTTADNYVVQIHQRAPDPLHQLIVASALCIDTTMKQSNGN